MKVLSKENTSLKVLLPLVLGVVVSVVILELIKGLLLLRILLLLLVIGFSIIWAYRRYRVTYDLFYNQEYLIIKSKRAERRVQLEKVTRIKRILGKTRIFGVEYQEYRLDFKNEKNLLEGVDFQLSTIDSNLTAFQNLMKRVYPEIVIENKTF